MSELIAPQAGTRYPALAYRGHPDVVRATLAILLAMLGYLFTVGFVNSAVVAVGYAFSAKTEPFGDYAAQAQRFERPIGMLGAHLGIGMLALVAIIVGRYVLGLRPGYVVSVAGRTRWGLLAISFVIAAVVINTSVWIFQRSTLQHFAPQPHFWIFFSIIVLTSPLQAAAEEFFFRGLLTQTLGVLTRVPWVGVVGSAVIFALFHGTQSTPLFLDRLGFGLLAGALVYLTGGLEAGIAAHIANNLSAFLYAALFSTVSAARTQTEVTWAAAVADLASFTLIGAACWLIARRTHAQVEIPAQQASLAKQARVR